MKQNAHKIFPPEHLQLRSTAVVNAVLHFTLFDQHIDVEISFHT